MSIPVEIPDLRSTAAEYGWAYLLTVRDDARPHIVAVTPVWEGEDLVMPVGGGTAANAAARPSVSLCYPPPESDGYSLIVDGRAEVSSTDHGAVGREVRFRPSGAVLHRPAPEGFTGSATGCANDCAPVSASSPPRPDEVAGRQVLQDLPRPRA
jgi:hypothetical protein